MKHIVQINNISKQYGKTVLFENVSLGIAENAKIGMIGRNGAGKSTLCKMIIGQEEPDSGSIDMHKLLRYSYLEQHDPFELDETVIGFLERHSGEEAWKCGKVAGQFNIKGKMLNETPIGELSGGYRTRVKLASMMLNEPNLLILDEPTNYLDLNTLLLLEHFLKNYNGAFIIVSHDREFLKRTCLQTLELEHASANFYPGSIEEYLEFKVDLIDHRTRLNKNLEIKQKRLEEFVEKFKAKNTKARQAQSKQKQIDRMEKIEIKHPVRSVNIKIPPSGSTKRGWSFISNQLSVGYPDNVVAAGIDIEVPRGAHVAVLGDNGQGKTTFLRSIAGDLKLKDGSIRWAKGEDSAFYAQHVYHELDPSQDVLTSLTHRASPTVSQQEVLNMAGCFLFSGDDVYKPVSVLSGGEKARLCLAGLLLSKKPVLLLDEPTNHLDFETVEALGEALDKYDGTIFFVSHDRTFVSMLASNIVEVKDSKIMFYPGSYEDYVYHLEQKVEREMSGLSGGDKADRKDKNKNHHQIKKERRAALKKLRKELEGIEQKMAVHEQEKSAIISVFALDPTKYSIGQNKRLDELNKLLSEEENIWLDLTDRLEEMETEEV